MAVEEWKSPDKIRTEHVEKLINLLALEFSAEEICQREFIEAVLLVTQLVCGPTEVAKVIRDTQVYQGR